MRPMVMPTFAQSEYLGDGTSTFMTLVLLRRAQRCCLPTMSRASVLMSETGTSMMLSNGPLKPSTTPVPRAHQSSVLIRTPFGVAGHALSLSGYSKMEIQKMGRWRTTTFMEYIREELACFSVGMSTKMQKKCGFVNVTGGMYTDVTDDLINTLYSANVLVPAV